MKNIEVVMNPTSKLLEQVAKLAWKTGAGVIAGKSVAKIAESVVNDLPEGSSTFHLCGLETDQKNVSVDLIVTVKNKPFIILG